MRLAVLSESEADEAFLRIVTEAIAGEPADWQGYRRRAYGVESVFEILPPLLKTLHRNPDVDGLVVVVDSDDSPLHKPEHEPAYTDERCRFCQLKALASRSLATARLPTEWKVVKNSNRTRSAGNRGVVSLRA